MKIFRVIFVLSFLIFGVAPAFAGPFRYNIAAKRQERAAEKSSAARAPKGSQVLRDVAYGADAAQTLDVYSPENAKNAPIIFMVHGGGWASGDKALPRVAANKAAYYLPKGYIFISTNYRLLPEADPLEQARDVALAIAFVQANAKEWGGDPSRIVLMGHSAGAHLISLINVNPAFADSAGAKPWLGAASLDSGAYDVEQVMSDPHAPLFDAAFGANRDYWRKASPISQIGENPAPMLLVCSSQRKESCKQAKTFKAALNTKRGSAVILPVDLTHRSINESLGLPSSYTKAVDQFLRSIGLP